MNERAFRGDLVGGFATGTIWLPCVCYLLRNLLSRFVENVPDVVRPKSRLQQRFRKRGPFLSFLESRDIRAQAIPPSRMVRWYSSNVLFSTLLRLWDHIVDFTVQEGITVNELNGRVKTNLQIIAQLTGRFADAQKELEQDDFGRGSRFTGHLLGITHAVDKLGQEQPGGVQGFHRQVEDFQRRYARECQFLSLMTSLDPSTQFIPCRTCPGGERDEMLRLLEVLVGTHLSRETAEQAEQVARMRMRVRIGRRGEDRRGRPPRVRGRSTSVWNVPLEKWDGRSLRFVGRRWAKAAAVERI
jgi:hypothetical protein